MEGGEVEQETHEHKVELAIRSSSLPNRGEIILQNRSHPIDFIEVGGMLPVAHLKPVSGFSTGLHSLQLRYGAFATWVGHEA